MKTHHYSNVPSHIGIIPDGNRRWAEARGLPRHAGYDYGLAPALELVEACTQLGLAPAEALAACTLNAAHVLGRAHRVGRLEPGLDADIVLLDAADWRYLAYHLAGEHVALVVKEGEVVWER